MLEMYINEYGKKVSDRKLFSNKEFQEKTGLFKLNRITGEKEPISCGGISDWKNKTGLNEYEIFKFGKASGRIDSNIEFSNWSNYKNKGKTNTKGETTLFDPHSIKKKLIKYFGLSDSLLFHDLTRLEKSVMDLFNSLGLNGKEELTIFYKKLKGGELDV